MWFINKRIDLLPHEKETLRRLLLCAVFTGIMQAVWVVIPELIRNTLQAEKVHVVFITLMWPMGQLIATYWGAYLDGKADKRVPLVLAGLFGRLPLAFGALFDTVEPILFFFIFSVITHPAVIASQHSLLQSNFREPIRGKAYSYIVSLTTLTSLVSALCFGIWLDANPENYRWIIMIASLAGCLEAVLMARVKAKVAMDAVYRKMKKKKRALTTTLIKPWKELYQLFKEDRQFFRFEMSFMVYGMGFMIMQPFITLFLVNDLNLTYTQISLSKGTILQACVIFLVPYAGRVFDKKNPVLFGSFVFLAISVFPAMMMITGMLELENPEYMVYLSYFVLSIGWSGLILLWNLGSMFFADKHDVSRYTGAHVVMVGVRGTLAFIIGLLIVEHITSMTAFAFCLGCWILASLLMIRHWMKSYRTVDVEVTREIAESHPQ